MSEPRSWCYTAEQIMDIADTLVTLVKERDRAEALLAKAASQLSECVDFIEHVTEHGEVHSGAGYWGRDIVKAIRSMG